MKPPETSASTCAFAVVVLMVLAATHAGAQTEPRGGQPPLWTQPSVPDLEAQVA